MELPRAVFLCPVSLHSLSRHFSFDLIINTGSMGEMGQDWVEFWNQSLAQQNARVFYSHNYFGNSVENLFEGENLMAPERKRLMKWNLTALTYMHVDDWVDLFAKVGYTGDYYWFIAE